jgi:hypothetical protein
MLLCGVMIDEPAGGEMGSEAAAPFFRQIITQVVSHPELEFAEKLLESNNSDKLQHMPETIQAAELHRPAASTSTLPAGVPATAQGKDCIPDCVGKDLRDAVNLVNTRGFKPFAVGFGMVTKQLPSAGTRGNPAAACTLFCSVRG